MEKDTTLSQWVSEEVQKALSEEDPYEVAGKKALKRLRKGLHLGGAPLKREECHER